MGSLLEKRHLCCGTVCLGSGTGRCACGVVSRFIHKSADRRTGQSG